MRAAKYPGTVLLCSHVLEEREDGSRLVCSKNAPWVDADHLGADGYMDLDWDGRAWCDDHRPDLGEAMFVRHSGANFDRHFGPFFSRDELDAWLDEHLDVSVYVLPLTKVVDWNESDSDVLSRVLERGK